jgi:hypothetical protein
LQPRCAIKTFYIPAAICEEKQVKCLLSIKERGEGLNLQ